MCVLVTKHAVDHASHFRCIFIADVLIVGQPRRACPTTSLLPSPRASSHSARSPSHAPSSCTPPPSTPGGNGPLRRWPYSCAPLALVIFFPLHALGLRYGPDALKRRRWRLAARLLPRPVIHHAGSAKHQQQPTTTNRPISRASAFAPHNGDGDQNEPRSTRVNGILPSCIFPNATDLMWWQCGGTRRLSCRGSGAYHSHHLLQTEALRRYTMIRI
ncbi:hypothetical protein B0H14DRAFT_150198 [Mycena olivaceomarginata]|nr:hypothetical protein B0H14DRAFT_150198 [Mycena olivaceomarginata]